MVGRTPQSAYGLGKRPAGRATLALSRALAGVAAAGLVLMMVHVVADVVARTLFGTALVGTLEIVSSYYMVLVVFLPLAITQAREGNILVSLFTAALPPRVVEALDGAIRLVFAAAAALFVWVTVGVALDKTAIGESITSVDLRIPVWPSRWLPPLGAAVLCAVLVVQAATRLGRALGETEGHG